MAAGLFERIDRPRRLPDEIARSISEAIYSGQLKPGDRLPTEQSLSDQFGVARTVVREAVSLLKYDGVISSKRGVGAFVSDVASRSAFRISGACFEKRRQLIQLLELRTGVQADASALAAEARTAPQLADISRRLAAMADATTDGQDWAANRLDAQDGFYRAITEASGNDYYVEFIAMIERNVSDNLRSVAIKNAMASEWGREVLEEHRAVYRALEAGNPDEARIATRNHFERAAQRLANRADIADV
ncbi:FadR/GntR family transcriptional regulator [Acuticoccus sp. MNP-M23]|uniref:FadR/GntR family transcriptional regulator n=1 Tax=Acuticoccus sp. MNP-M23 TaxID=3072793 RepID=UPI0028167E6C|nr:FadR/GntR family transcriptional regulator [Acuticoccus sp. MNP-M23]WMS44336.1 FadR/GntR family transcriptional regulator [Acuticoccus sp. MNP-M23]